MSGRNRSSTPGDILRTHTVHPQLGIDIRDQFGAEIIIDGGGRLGMRATYDDVQSLDGYLDCEE